jgi:hypothetical protein
LAVEIADTIIDAAERERRLDLAAEAERLVRSHPEATVSPQEVADVLREEESAAGLASIM